MMSESCEICGRELCARKRHAYRNEVGAVVEHWRCYQKGYELKKAAYEEEHAVRMQLEAAHATLMREALARTEAAEAASFDAEERTEEYRRLVETRDEAIAALDAGIGKDVEGVRLAAALAQEKDAREAAEKQRDAAIAHAFVAVGAARAEERRRALVDARDAVRKAVEPGPYRYTAVLAIESLASAPAPLQSPPEQDASHVEAGASRGETSIRIHRASRGSGTSMNDDPKGLMAEQRERLGPLCTHFRYASRCEECGAPPMKAQTDPPPDKDPEG